MKRKTRSLIEREETEDSETDRKREMQRMGTERQRGKGFAPAVSSNTCQDANIQCFPADPSNPVISLSYIQHIVFTMKLATPSFNEEQAGITVIVFKT